MIANHDYDCNIRECPGTYQSDCAARGCDRETRRACQDRAAWEKQCRDRRGELGPRAAYLVRTWRYAPNEVRDLDEGGY